MKVTKVTFDANILITRPVDVLPANFYMSAVVLQELVAGAADTAAVKDFRRAYTQFKKEGRLLVPIDEDWWLVGIILNNLQRSRRDKRTKLIPRISVEERLRITNDTLIARTARREGVTVITDNTNDFNKIQPYCAVRHMTGAAYFGS